MAALDQAQGRYGEAEPLYREALQGRRETLGPRHPNTLTTGANRALANKEHDGILFALEAQGLNPDGGELVVLSACDTARGSFDYSEGFYGLVRAFRTAGARNAVAAERRRRPRLRGRLLSQLAVASRAQRAMAGVLQRCWSLA